MQDDTRPRVFITTPTRGPCAVEQTFSRYIATRNAALMPGFSKGSLLGRQFNKLWADALDYAEAGVTDYLLIHHDDIEPVTPSWLDLMIEDMQKFNAAIMCPVVPLKSHRGDTSTAMNIPGTWKTRKLMLDECWKLPQTFCAEDVRSILGLKGELVINSGLLLIDLRRPEFHEDDENGHAKFLFTVQDRIVRGKDGKRVPECWSEDWDFSARCNAAGLPVYATWKIGVIHHGGGEWGNQPPQENKS